MVIKLGLRKIYRVDYRMLTHDLFAVANLLAAMGDQLDEL